MPGSSSSAAAVPAGSSSAAAAFARPPVFHGSERVDDLHDRLRPVDEDDVDREAHEERHDGRGAVDQHPLARARGRRGRAGRASARRALGDLATRADDAAVACDDAGHFRGQPPRARARHGDSVVRHRLPGRLRGTPPCQTQRLLDAGPVPRRRGGLPRRRGKEPARAAVRPRRSVLGFTTSHGVARASPSLRRGCRGHREHAARAACRATLAGRRSRLRPAEAPFDLARKSRESRPRRLALTRWRSRLDSGGRRSDGCSWLTILRLLGVRTRQRWIRIFFQAQLAKYIPGTVWQYAGRVALSQAHGSSSGPSASHCLPSSGRALLPLPHSRHYCSATGESSPSACSRRGARRRSGRGAVGATRAGVQAGTAVVPLFAVSWLAIGAGFWLTAHALIRVPVGDLLVYIGAFAAAWVVGLAAIYAPGGLGVREAVIVALLRGRIGTADALVVAAASRALLTLVDLIAAGVGVIMLRHDDATASLVTVEPRDQDVPESAPLHADEQTIDP